MGNKHKSKDKNWNELRGKAALLINKNFKVAKKEPGNLQNDKQNILPMFGRNSVDILPGINERLSQSLPKKSHKYPHKKFNILANDPVNLAKRSRIGEFKKEGDLYYKRDKGYYIPINKKENPKIKLYNSSLTSRKKQDNNPKIQEVKKDMREDRGFQKRRRVQSIENMRKNYTPYYHPFWIEQHYHQEKQRKNDDELKTLRKELARLKAKNMRFRMGED
mmetsp:Transcript_3940/g.3297  ORF Transcript_3940/g.3297 Transcript_3940/m.3297 type:complete len:220 (+) Transcript_3940:10-669(+)